MNTKLDDKVLMDMVFRCLCRVLKNKKIYHRFRCFVGVGNKTIYGNDLSTSIYTILKCMQPYVMDAQQGDNPFCSAANREDIFKILKQLIGEDNTIAKDDRKDMGKVQMRITQILNTLLHSCVEKTVNSFLEIENIGQETFEMVCKKIYGDDFVDETEKNTPEEVKKLIHAQREYLEHNGMVDPRNLTSDPRFIEFLKDRGVIGENGNRRRPMRMMPPTLDRLADESISPWYEVSQSYATDYDSRLDEWLLDEDDEWI